MVEESGGGRRRGYLEGEDVGWKWVGEGVWTTGGGGGQRNGGRRGWLEGEEVGGFWRWRVWRRRWTAGGGGGQRNGGNKA